jgi:hypothetical protein
MDEHALEVQCTGMASLNALLSNLRSIARLLHARRRVYIRCDDSALEMPPHYNGSLLIGETP